MTRIIPTSEEQQIPTEAVWYSLTHHQSTHTAATILRRQEHSEPITAALSRVEVTFTGQSNNQI